MQFIYKWGRGEMGQQRRRRAEERLKILTAALKTEEMPQARNASSHQKLGG